MARRAAQGQLLKATGNDDAMQQIMLMIQTMRDEQKAMLLPVEARLAALTRQTPADLQTAASKHRKGRKKNKWCQKFKGESAGKSKAKWQARLATVGKEKGLEEGPEKKRPGDRRRERPEDVSQALRASYFGVLREWISKGPKLC